MPAFPAFPRTEFDRRHAIFRDNLARKHIRCAILFNRENIAYFSGFRTTIDASAIVWSALVVPVDRDPILIVSHAISNVAREATWIEDLRVVGGAEYWGHPLDPFSVLHDAAGPWNTGLPIGVELAPRTPLPLSWPEVRRLEGWIANFEVRDVAASIVRQRALKSGWEQALYRRLGEITAIGFGAGIAAIAPGVSERTVEQTMWKAFIGAGASGSPVGGQLMIRSGQGRYDTFCGRATDRRTEIGDQVMLAGGPSLEGYHIDIHRHACLGPVPELQRVLFDQSRTGLEAAIEATRPGATTGDVYRAARKAMTARGANSNVPWTVFGHGLGLSNYEPPMISEHDKTPLEAGMILTIEIPAYDVPDFRVLGAFLEECVLVTPSGCEVLTAGVPRDLHVV